MRRTPTSLAATLVLVALLVSLGCSSRPPKRRLSEINSSNANASASTNRTSSANNSDGYASSYSMSNNSNNSSSATTISNDNFERRLKEILADSKSSSSGSASSSSYSTEDEGRAQRRRLFESWKVRMQANAQNGLRAALGSSDDFYRWQVEQRQLLEEYQRNNYREFDTGGAPGGYSGSSSGGYSGGSSSSSTRMCLVCKGTGQVDNCAYRNAYEPGFDPSTCRYPCTNCRGTGYVRN